MATTQKQAKQISGVDTAPVAEALRLVKMGLRPFVEREARRELGERFEQVVRTTLTNDRGFLPEDPFDDIHMLLRFMFDQWHAVFRKGALGQAERTYVRELQTIRNAWAHQDPMTADDVYRTLDTAQRLLEAVSAEEAADLARMKVAYREQQMQVSASAQSELAPTLGQPKSGLKPWREVITPHPDVASGRYQKAEFAADLSQVHRGDATEEYGDPEQFFARTHMTAGLRELLVGALRRLSKTGGEPIIELQTNFGGGKTHSLLALYHLFGGAAVDRMAGVRELVGLAGAEPPPEVRRAVLVGTAISPGKVHEKPDGTRVHTLWGELAWQLGGSAGYELVAEADLTATSPGSEDLALLFREHGPALILIDEWVAYARQLRGDELPAGSFETHFTFAQALSEAARSVDGTLLVVSIPASEPGRQRRRGEDDVADIEIGGEMGREALERLKNAVGRMAESWRPANAEEGFEIVKRRLFGELRDPEARDAVVKAFFDLYRKQAGDFPADCREKSYTDRIAASYPIHPELFDRLYEDWSSLEKFQRTRGVLRLMAAVIHSLWENQDQSLLIMPGMIPIGDPDVQHELTRYLPDNWVPVIETDVDGPNSLSLAIDRSQDTFGRYSAARRVSRSIYLGSAPTVNTANRGVESPRVSLSCVQPGETVAIFGDVLRRLADRSQHLYSERSRYWFSTQPTVLNVASDRAETQRDEDVEMEIISRLREDRARGYFSGVHVAPSDSSAVPDEQAVRLVVLGPEDPHTARGTAESPAMAKAREILERRGSAPRLNRNMLIFAACDKTKLVDLKSAVRLYLAWASIQEDREDLNLDQQNLKQVEKRLKESRERVLQTLREAYQWVLVPTQPDPKGPVVWEELKVAGQEPLAERASKRLASDEQLIPALGGTRLRHELDRIPLWRGDDVPLGELWSQLTQYLYLPRLREASVLLDAVVSAVASTAWTLDGFAYADGKSASGRYEGLIGGSVCRPILNDSSVLVQPEVAIAQLAAERPSGAVIGGSAAGVDTVDTTASPDGAGGLVSPTVSAFHATLSVDPQRAVRELTDAIQNVVQHLVALGDVSIRLEVEADLSGGGVSEAVQRTVTENARTLDFDHFGFE